MPRWTKARVRLLALGLAGVFVAAGCAANPGSPAVAAPSVSVPSAPAAGLSVPRATVAPPTGRYVAMGTSFAAGTGIGPDIGAGCLRSAENYPHLVAARFGLTLDDVTCAGAILANLLRTPQRDHPPQVDAVGDGVATTLIRPWSDSMSGAASGDG